MAVAGVFYSLASISLVLALVMSWISFLSPYWLGNATTPWPGRHTESIEHDLSYISAFTASLPSTVSHRGLWAQCRVFETCQWFWQYDYSLQKHKFTPLGWHLATQVLYSVGVVLLLLCEIYVRAQMCCGAKHYGAYRALSLVLFISFTVQAAAVCAFGGFASRDYGVTGAASTRFTYLGWCYWLAVAASSLTLSATLMFAVVGFCVKRFVSPS